MWAMFECDGEQVMIMFTCDVPGPFVEKPKNQAASNSNGSEFP